MAFHHLETRLTLACALGLGLAAAGCADNPVPGEPGSPGQPGLPGDPGDGPGGGDPDGGAPHDTAAPSPGDAVFALDKLHEIDIVVAEADLDKLENDRTQRVPCTFTFDGVTLQNVGIRQKEGNGSRSDLNGKPGLSIKFDELTDDQTLDGLGKLVLNNAIQDPTLLHEHLGYELYRRAGIPASRTSHAIVTLNGFTYGIYVVAEPIEKAFLKAHVDGSGKGNLYEAPCCGDFVTDPEFPELKDEDDGRTRDDLRAAAAAVRDTPDDQLEATLGQLIDLDGFITGYAIDVLVDHWDGYSFNMNNYYIYHRKSDGRLMFLPHGMDQLFQDSQRDPDAEPSGQLSARVRQVPALDARFRAALQHVLATAWDVAALQARMDQVSAVVHTTTRTDRRVRGDLDAFDENLAIEKAKLADRKAQLAQP